MRRLYRPVQDAVLLAIDSPRFSFDLPDLRGYSWKQTRPISLVKQECLRLAFVGDAIASVCIANQLYELMSDGSPHLYHVLRSALVSNITWSRLLIKSHSLAFSGSTVNFDPLESWSTKGNADDWEAILGLMFNQKGMYAVRCFLEAVFSPLIHVGAKTFYEVQRENMRLRYFDPGAATWLSNDRNAKAGSKRRREYDDNDELPYLPKRAKFDSFYVKQFNELSAITTYLGSFRRARHQSERSHGSTHQLVLSAHAVSSGTASLSHVVKSAITNAYQYGPSDTSFPTTGTVANIRPPFSALTNRDVMPSNCTVPSSGGAQLPRTRELTTSGVQNMQSLPSQSSRQMPPLPLEQRIRSPISYPLPPQSRERPVSPVALERRLRSPTQSPASEGRRCPPESAVSMPPQRYERLEWRRESTPPITANQPPELPPVTRQEASSTSYHSKSSLPLEERIRSPPPVKLRRESWPPEPVPLEQRIRSPSPHSCSHWMPRSMTSREPIYSAISGYWHFVPELRAYRPY